MTDQVIITQSNAVIVLQDLPASSFSVVAVGPQGPTGPTGPSGTGGVALSASGSSISSGTLVFSNSNGVSFGMNGSVLTASVQTNYQSTGAYLTTAMQSNAGSNFVNVSQSSVFQLSSNTSAITSNALPASQSTLFQFSSNTSAITANALNTSQSSLFALTSNNSLYQLTSNTSAITSNAFAASATTKFAGVGTTFSGTNVLGSMTMNSNGLQLALSAGAGGGGGIAAAISGNTSGALATVSSGTMLLFGGNNITLSQNGQSITLSGANAGGAQTAISGLSAGTTQMTSGTAVFSNSNGISFGVNGNTITASYNSTQFLTTAMLSNASTSLAGTGTSATNATFTLNSNGLAFNGGAYQLTSNTSAITSNALNTSVSSNFMFTSNASLYQLTSNTSNITSNAFAASATTKFAGTGTTFAGTNVSGTIAMNSNGLNLALSAGAGGGGGAGQVISASGNTAGTLTTFSSGTMVLAGGNNVTLSQSSNSISFNAPNQSYFVAGANITLSSSSNSISIIGGAGGGGGTTYNGVGIADSAGTQTSGTVIFSNSNQVSFGLSAGTMTASIPNFTSASSLFLQTSQSSLFDLTANRSQLQYSSNTSAITALAFPSANTTQFAGTGTSATNASITMNSNGLAISVAAPSGGAVTISDWTPFQLAASSTTSFAQNTLHFMHVLPPAYAAVTAIEMLWSFSHNSTSSPAWTNARTLSYGIYAENTSGGATAFSLLGSSSFALIISASSNLSMGITMSQGTNSQTYSSASSAISAFNQNQWKIMSLPFATTLTPNSSPYYFGYVMSTATTGTNIGLTHQYIMNNEQSNASNGAWAVTGFTASNKSIIQEPYGFIYSVTSGGLGGSYAYSDMSINSNTQPYLYFEA